jgi:Zn-finger nucleic acid-binding protein
MPEAEPRLECPVCLGVRMDKIRPDPANPLLLDYCRRCGGIWFEAGELGLIRQLRPRGFLRKVHLAANDRGMQCHACHQRLDRNADACPNCGWANRIRCPGCSADMPRTNVSGLHLDYCRPCKGVWFDNIELSEIWNSGFDEMVQRKSAGSTVGWAGDEAAAFFVDVIVTDPTVVGFGAQAVAETGRIAVTAAEQLVAGAPTAAGAAAEGAGDLASAVFGAIADIVSGIC